MPRPRVLLLADRSRPEVAELFEEIRDAVQRCADIVDERDADNEPLPDDLGVDLVVVLGGDGTLISQARRVIGHGLPLVGVNFGRLGFLAEFDAASLLGQAEAIFDGAASVQKRLALFAELRDPDGVVIHTGIALNECVVTAGPPYRMIELDLAVDGEAGPRLRGDGVIVATPTGSTAYNASAGGPIVHPAVEAFIVTPLAAHSLAFRPLVLSGSCALGIRVRQANEGTTLVFDGQLSVPLQAGMSVTIGRHHRDAHFVMNPAMSYWRILLDKMRWAAPPGYRQ